MTSENETASAAKRCGLCGAAFSDAWHWTRDDTPICAACAPQRVRSEVDPASAEISAEPVYYYECQERAFAPGIGDGWPEVIPAPHSKNARLVRRRGNPTETEREAQDLHRSCLEWTERAERAEAATAALRSQLDAERHARALYQDEHATLLDERSALRSQLTETQRSREQLDCQYAGAFGESDGASHCPPDRPCQRCALEGERETLRRERDALSEALGIEAAERHIAEQERDAARAEAEWRGKRLDMLQRAQREMRDPERKVVCDILANGTTYVEPFRAALAQEPKT